VETEFLNSNDKQIGSFLFSYRCLARSCGGRGPTMANTEGDGITTETKTDTNRRR